MSYAWALFRHAEKVLAAAGGPTWQADIRRAVSSAYYALFHLLVEQAAKHAASGAPLPVQMQIRRSLQHKEMRKACEAFARAGRSKPSTLEHLLERPVEDNLTYVADTFIRMQDARHTADYDLSSDVTLTEAESLLHSVGFYFMFWQDLHERPNARTFLAALLFHERWTRRG